MAKKRANGEGSIRRRKDGRWEGRYTAGHDPETGKAVYKNVLGKTQAEVKEKLAKAIEKSKRVDIVRAEKYTLGQWMEIWFENYARIKVRPSFHATYRGYLDNHILPNIGNIPLNRLTTLDIQKFYKKLLECGRVVRAESKGQPRGLSAKTVRNLHQILSSALDLAVQQRLIPSNPAAGCASPQGRATGDQDPDNRSAERLLPGSKSQRGIGALLSGSGYRPSPGRTAGASLGGYRLAAPGTAYPPPAGQGLAGR